MRIKKTVAFITALLFVFSFTACNNSYKKNTSSSTNLANIESGSTSAMGGYADKLFGDEVMKINIIVDENEWQNMLDNAKAEEYISVNVDVNGEIYENVGIRVKGNSSLNMIANDDTDRYSFKIKFDKYVDNQTCQGLDKLVLNNVISDNTYMKDYLAFQLMNFMDVDGALYNYSYTMINGEYSGLYIALESYENSFAQRVYGDDDNVNMYNVKVENMGGNAGDMPNAGNGNMQTPPDMPNAESGNMQTPPDMPNMENGDIPINSKGKFSDVFPDGFDFDDFYEATQSEDFDFEAYLTEHNLSLEDFNFSEDITSEEIMDFIEKIQSNDFSKIGGGMGGGMGAGDTGGSLKYTSDSISDYSSIFDNAVFKHTTEEDEQKVITALKKLSEGEDLEEYFDVDKILRYLAVHTVLSNFDSYSSTMAQNYYVCETDGVISVLPWDYNLSFGAFQANASDAVNFPIDTPVYGVEMEDRPLISGLLAVEEYSEKYHEYLQEIVDDYFNSGYFESLVNEIDQKISGYVETDPTKFCTFEEYKTGIETVKQFGKLRAESIAGQLAGTIPSTTDGQKKDSSLLVNCDDINISDMGSQNGEKGGGFGGYGNMPNADGMPTRPNFNGNDGKTPSTSTSE